MTLLYDTPRPLQYARTITFADLPGGYVASLVYQNEPFFGGDGPGKDLLRWTAVVHDGKGGGEQRALFTELRQGLEWLEWQIADLCVRFPQPRSKR